MIEADDIVKAAKKLDIKNLKIEMTNWILDKVELQRVRREIEKYGPSLEHISQEIIDRVLDAEMVLAHYAPLPGD